jgi:hypothetical protein
VEPDFRKWGLTCRGGVGVEGVVVVVPTESPRVGVEPFVGCEFLHGDAVAMLIQFSSDKGSAPKNIKIRLFLVRL